MAVGTRWSYWLGCLHGDLLGQVRPGHIGAGTGAASNPEWPQSSPACIGGGWGYSGVRLGAAWLGWAQVNAAALAEVTALKDRSIDCCP